MKLFLTGLDPSARFHTVSQILVEARAKYEAKLRGIKNFSASDGWFSRWRWRYAISKATKLHGEAGDVNIEAAESEMRALRESLKDYSLECIFNMDELGLFYRAIPNRTYLLSSEGDKRQRGRGSKSMHAKERITVILCVNATGTCKMPPTVIGSSKNPRCFKKSRPCVPYFHQSNAWNDTVTYNQWWQEVFLPAIRLFTKERVALVMDGFSGHDRKCTDPLCQVQVYILPPNVTSVYQPQDQGIIAALKVGYRSKLLEKIVSNADKFPKC